MSISISLPTDSGAPVYQYELQHPPSVLLDKRPSFVKVDHGDDIVFVFGSTFMRSHVKIRGNFFLSMILAAHGRYPTLAMCTFNEQKVSSTYTHYIIQYCLFTLKQALSQRRKMSSLEQSCPTGATLHAPGNSTPLFEKDTQLHP